MVAVVDCAAVCKWVGLELSLFPRVHTVERACGAVPSPSSMTLFVPAGKNMPFIVAAAILQTGASARFRLLDVFGRYTRSAAPQRFQLQ